MQRLTRFALATVLLGGLTAGCSQSPPENQTTSSANQQVASPQVVAADGVLCDLTRTLATPAIVVHCLLSGGEDPHTFSLLPEQRSHLEQADLVLINGLGLTPVLARLVEQGKAVAVGENIPLQPLEAEAPAMSDGPDHGNHDDHGDHGDHEDHGHGHDHGAVDPHVWHNPKNTQAMAGVITQELVQLVPGEAAALQELNQKAVAVLKDMDEWAEDQVETIAPQQRVLATRHKAFGYYAQRYGLRELALLDSFSTNEVSRPAALNNLRRELDEANVAMLFPEQIPPSQSLAVIAEQTGVPLSSQSLSADGLAPGQSTVETFVTNTCAIVEGLQGECDKIAGEDLFSRWQAITTE